MSQLITIHKKQAMVSHRVIAEHTENKSKNIKELIDKYQDDFEEFGQLLFQTESVKNSVGAVNQTKTYYLNEQQATLLMTYLKNSSVVRAFKVALVKEFYKMRDEVYHKKIKIPEELNINPSALNYLQHKFGDLNDTVRRIDSKFEVHNEQNENIQKILEQSNLLLKYHYHQIEEGMMDAEQARVVKRTIEERGRFLAVTQSVLLENAIPSIYRAIKPRFNVSTYYEVPRKQFSELIEFIQTITL